MSAQETVLLLGYLTNKRKECIPVIGIPYQSDSLQYSHPGRAREALPRLLGLKPKHLIIFETDDRNPNLCLAIVKPCKRKKVRKALKGAIVWLDPKSVVSGLAEQKSSRRKRITQLIKVFAWHESIKPFVAVLTKK